MFGVGALGTTIIMQQGGAKTWLHKQSYDLKILQPGHESRQALLVGLQPVVVTMKGTNWPSTSWRLLVFYLDSYFSRVQVGFRSRRAVEQDHAGDGFALFRPSSGKSRVFHIHS